MIYPDRWGQSKIATIGVDGRMVGDFTLTPEFPIPIA